uniref:N-acetylmuramoyl-L-alanine amidase n=1 Tax=Parastrongyloides trichosuri TaxID=131310 RepID=A0A0N4ZVX1_PARTI
MKSFEKILDKIRYMKSDFSVYPINVGRNIARLGMETRLFLSGDIENFPSYNYEKIVSELAAKYLLKQKRKIVLVHRRFEYEKGLETPRNKAELKDLILKKQANVFHEKVYPNGHMIVGLHDWLHREENVNEATVDMTINFSRSAWEPQFVGDERLPFHDERFFYRIRSNTHLILIMCYLQYRFTILNDVFTVHEGIKRNKIDPLPRASYGNLMKARKILDELNVNLSIEYPDMVNKCPKGML